MMNFTELMASELEEVEKHLEKYNIKKIENTPLRNKNGTGKKRVISIRKKGNNNLEIIWSYDNYN